VGRFEHGFTNTAAGPCGIRCHTAQLHIVWSMGNHGCCADDRNGLGVPILIITNGFALRAAQLESYGKKVDGVGVVVTGKNGLLAGHAQRLTKHPVSKVKLRGTFGGRRTLPDSEPHHAVGCWVVLA
jgi:hypothetical protein